MNVVGFEPLTLSDFPGRVAAMVFAPGCNFRCPFCHNGALLNTASGQPFSDLYPQLERRRNLLDGVVFSGGEPTLQGGLADSLARCHELGLETKLDTNGSQPQVLKTLLNQNLLDYIAMDVKAPWDHYERLAGCPVNVQALEESVHIIAASGVDHQFRTTWVPGLLTDADMERIKSQIPIDSLHRLQPFVAELAWDPTLRRAS